MAGSVFRTSIHSISTCHHSCLRRHISNRTEDKVIGTEVYEFFPDEVKNSLPKLYAQEQVKDPIVHVKFFTPWTSWTWFATEGEQQDGDFIFFGYVIGHEREWGYFSLNELQTVTGPMGLKIERDIYFTPKPRSQVSDIK